MNKEADCDFRYFAPNTASFPRYYPHSIFIYLFIFHILGVGEVVVFKPIAKFYHHTEKEKKKEEIVLTVECS